MTGFGPRPRILHPPRANDRKRCIGEVARGRRLQAGCRRSLDKVQAAAVRP